MIRRIIKLDSRKIKVFLDSNVLIEILRGKIEFRKLLSKEFTGKLKYAVNPIVVQEIMLASQKLEGINADSLTDIVEIIPLEIISEKELKEVRNFFVHSNNLLILESAEKECEYLVTLDMDFLKLKNEGKLKILTPENFIKEMEGK